MTIIENMDYGGPHKMSANASFTHFKKCTIGFTATPHYLDPVYKDLKYKMANYENCIFEECDFAGMVSSAYFNKCTFISCFTNRLAINHDCFLEECIFEGVFKGDFHFIFGLIPPFLDSQLNKDDYIKFSRSCKFHVDLSGADINAIFVCYEINKIKSRNDSSTLWLPVEKVLNNLSDFKKLRESGNYFAEFTTINNDDDLRLTRYSCIDGGFYQIKKYKYKRFKKEEAMISDIKNLLAQLSP